MSKTPATDDLIALICKAASEKYREDKIRPDIQIAYIPAEPRTTEDNAPFWYVALLRYPNHVYPLLRDSDGRCVPTLNRVVVHKAEHEELDRAVQLLALQLLPVEAQAELAEAIKGVKP